MKNLKVSLPNVPHFPKSFSFFLFFFPANEPEVQEIFNDSDNKFSSGDSQLSNILLKFIAPELVSRLTRLMNMGLKKAFLPIE